jgi:hypothetical protein
VSLTPISLLMSAFSLPPCPALLALRLQSKRNASLLIAEASANSLPPIIVGARDLDESAITHCLNDSCF